MTVAWTLGLGRTMPCVIGLSLLLFVETALGDPPPGSGDSAHGPPATATTPAPETKSEATPAETKILEPVKPDEAVAVLGKKVRGPDGKDIVGTVVDALIDGDGRPRAAIIDFGGFLGVGSRKIAVDWQSLTFRPADHDAPLLLSLDRAQIQAAPEYKESTKPAEVVTSPTASSPAAPPVTTPATAPPAASPPVAAPPAASPPVAAPPAASPPVTPDAGQQAN